MIKFKKLRYRNFLSQGDKFVEIQLDQDDTTIITGTNGAGKTTFVDALMYALFNKPLRDVKLNQLVNSVNKKKMVSEIEFAVNGNEYKIIRGQKPAIFEIYSNDVLINQDASARDLQNKLESEILRTDYQTFTQVVILASMKFANFMDLNPKERRTVVENMLDIEVIGQMSTLLKERVKDVKRRADGADMNHREFVSKINNVQRLIDANQDNTAEQLAQFDLSIVDLDGKISNLSAKYEGAKLSLEQEQDLKPNIDVEGNKAAFTNHSETQKKLNIIRQNQASQVAINNNSIVTYKREASFYIDNTDCGTCGQHIDEDFKKRIVDGYAEKTKDAETKLVQHKKYIAEADERLANINTQLDDIRVIAQVLQTWQNKCDIMLNQLNDIQNSISREQQYKQSTINQKNVLLNKTQNNNDGYFDEISSLNESISEIVNLRAEITEEMELCNLCGAMLKDNGLKSKIIKQYLPIINDSINYYLDKLGAHYSFTLDSEFNETIKSRYRDTFSYGSFSNGESMRINLSILFMWRKLAESKNTVHTNLLIMDEVLDGSLDSEGIQAVLGMFEEANSNVFVISHRHEIIPQFDRHIQVSKVGNFASYDGLTDEV
jgi:DNA repair exonuclease SbcCD ATPase subunit